MGLGNHITLTVDPLPIANTPKDFETCDTTAGGNDTNEIATFDLSTKKSEVYKLQSTTDYDVKFYYDQSAADEAIDGSEILVPIQNSSNPQTIFARIEKKSNVDCYSTTSFKLIVNPLPEVEIEVTLTQCDDDTDGISKFNLTEANRLISTDFEDEEFTYYLTNAQAEEGNASDQITNVTNYPNPTVTNSSVFVRIENENDCYRTSKINLVVATTLLDPKEFKLEYSVCDDAQIDSDNSNGIATFDFSDATAKVLAQLPKGQDLTVSYYTSEADALAETSRIPDISNHRNISNPDIQQIYVRVDSNDVNACSGFGNHITLTVDPLPIKNTISDYVLCSTTDKATFDLTTKNSQVKGSQTDPILISYHLSEQNAIDNIRIPMASNYENISNPQTIYIRSQFDLNNNNASDAGECVRTDMSFDIEVSDLPIANTPKDFEICDNSDDGDDTNEIATFDLSTKKSEVYKLQSTTDYDVKFYYDQSAADEAIDGSEILVPIQNSSNPQTIFARIEKKSNVDCYSTTSFKLIVNPLPEVEIEVTLTQCDDDTDGISKFNLTEANRLISTDFEDEEFTYYLTNAQAKDGNASDQITNVTNYPNPTATNSSVFVRIENENDCYRTSEINLVVSATLLDPKEFKLKYSVCDDAQIDSDNSNGIATFDFSDATAKVLAQFPTGQSLTVSYYTSEADALAETSRIPDISNHRNTSNPDIQQIYVRVDSNDVNACLGLGNHITLTVDPLPIANTPKDFEICDNSDDGDDTNEIATFDLSTKKSEVYKLQSTTDYDVKFYYDQSAADEAIDGSEILVPIQNSSNPQTIFARIEKKSNVDCYSTTSFKLIVNPLPEVEIEVTLTQCDDDTDGISKFNLTEANRLISTDFEDEEFTYYLEKAQAEEGNASDQITNVTNYPNPTVTNSSVFVRIETENDCYRTSKINLVVSATLIPETFKLKYSVCYDAQIDSDNSNGIATFDFSDATAKVLAQLPTGQSLTVSYYTSEADALAETSRIPDISNHRNTSNPDIQQIYVRVDSNDVNACLGLGNHITLTVDPLPIANTPKDFETCDTTAGGNDTNEIATFDLSTKKSEVYKLQSTTDYDVKFYYDQSAADEAIDGSEILVPIQNSSNPQTIFARIEKKSNVDCYSTTSFKLIVNPLPEVEIEVTLTQCDDDTDGISKFNLTEANRLISTDFEDEEFTYYLTNAQAEEGNASDQITNVTNYPNPTVTNSSVFVRIENENDCYRTSKINLVVSATLIPETFKLKYSVCYDAQIDSDNSNGIATFDFSDATAKVLAQLPTGQSSDSYVLHLRSGCLSRDQSHP